MLLLLGGGGGGDGGDELFRLPLTATSASKQQATKAKFMKGAASENAKLVRFMMTTTTMVR